MPHERADLEHVWRRLSGARGDANQLRRIFDRTLVPMVLVDNDRRHVDANGASRLFLRRSLAELRGMQIEALTPPRLIPVLDDNWRRLRAQGIVAGEIALTLPDGPQMIVAYCGAANILPGAHLIVFAPASWPDDELGGLIDEDPASPSGSLTGREREVLALVATGADVREIANELSLSNHTVKTHVRNAMRRLGARNRSHAIALAMRAGEIT